MTDKNTLMVEKVNLAIKQNLNNSLSQKKTLVVKKNIIANEINNLIDYIAKSGNSSPSIQTALKQKESELLEIECQISRSLNKDFIKEISVESKDIVKWFRELEELVKDDIITARIKIGNLIGELTVTPLSQNHQTGLMLNGNPKIDGVLGAFVNSSTLKNSGEGI